MPKRIILTDDNVRTLRARGKADAAWSDLNSPLVLRVQGAKRSYSVRTRLNGKMKRFTIGAPSSMSLAEAQEEARRIVLDCQRGTDPADHTRELAKAKEAEAANTYETVVEDFIRLYAQKAQKTWPETRRTLLTNGADWRERPIGEITKRDAYELLEGFIADGHETKARVTLAWFRKLWRWAAQRDVVESPIMDSVVIQIETKARDRHFDDDEVRAVWEGAPDLTELECGFVRLLLLLGVRKGELAGMRRSEIVMPTDSSYPKKLTERMGGDAPVLWIVPHERTKTRKTAKIKRVYVVPLPALALSTLADLPQYDGDDADLVFPGRHHGKPLDPGTPLRIKIRDASKVADWSYHPCRDTITTWLQDEGHSEYERGLVLNHAGSGSVTSDYSHGYPVELKRDLLSKWASHVASIVSKDASSLAVEKTA